MTPLHPTYPSSSTAPDGVEKAFHDSGHPSNPQHLSNNPLRKSDDSCWGDIFSSLTGFSNPESFHDSELIQADVVSWEHLFGNCAALLSPGRLSSMPSPSGRSHAIRQENPSPLMGQMNSMSPYAPAAQRAHGTEFSLSNLDQDLDFSTYLNSPHILSMDLSPSYTRPDPRGSVERISISPTQLIDHDDSSGANEELSFDPNTASAADGTLISVTGEDVTAESLVSLLIMLKSLIFPPFDTGSQKYKYEKSVLSDLCRPYDCELLCSEVERLLEIYLEASLRSIRNRQAARSQTTLSSDHSFTFNKRRPAFRSLDGSQQLAKLTEVTIAPKLRRPNVYHYSKPTGQVIIEAGEGPRDLTSEDNLYLVNISLLPRAMERTLGLCVQLCSRKNGPSITPQINTFNVVPVDSAIFQCVRNKDLQGLQTLFDLGAASARDVDSDGTSLLDVSVVHNYGHDMFLLNIFCSVPCTQEVLIFSGFYFKVGLVLMSLDIIVIEEQILSLLCGTFIWIMLLNPCSSISCYWEERSPLSIMLK